DAADSLLSSATVERKVRRTLKGCYRVGAEIGLDRVEHEIESRCRRLRGERQSVGGLERDARSAKGAGCKVEVRQRLLEHDAGTIQRLRITAAKPGIDSPRDRDQLFLAIAAREPLLFGRCRIRRRHEQKRPHFRLSAVEGLLFDPWQPGVNPLVEPGTQ